MGKAVFFGGKMVDRAHCKDEKADQQLRRSMATKGKAASKPDTGANLGFENSGAGLRILSFTVRERRGP